MRFRLFIHFLVLQKRRYCRTLLRNFSSDCDNCRRNTSRRRSHESVFLFPTRQGAPVLLAPPFLLLTTSALHLYVLPFFIYVLHRSRREGFYGKFPESVPLSAMGRRVVQYGPLRFPGLFFLNEALPLLPYCLRSSVKLPRLKPNKSGPLPPPACHSPRICRSVLPRLLLHGSTSYMGLIHILLLFLLP